MSMMDAVRSVFSQYATFEGRARRSEYWYFYLFNALVSGGALIAASLLGALFKTGVFLALVGTLSWIYGLACIIPSIALVCRRLHDTGKSGAWYFIILTGIGSLLIFIFMIMDGTPGPNQYGPDPKRRQGMAYGQPYYPQQAPAMQPPVQAPMMPAPAQTPVLPLPKTAPVATAPYYPDAPTEVVAPALPEHMVRMPDGAIFPINGSVTIGRSQSCQISMAGYDRVSGRHCSLEVRNGAMYVTDLGSTNGTFVHGERINPNMPVRVGKGTSINLGKSCNITIC